MRAVGDDHVVAAVCGWVPDRLVLAHENGCDARGHAAEGWWDEEGGVYGRHWADGGEGVVRSGGGDVVPCARVGELGLKGGS